MKILRNIKRFLTGGKKREIREQFRDNPELMERFPEIYARLKEKISEEELYKMQSVLMDYEVRESERKRYLEIFGKDVKLQELYPEQYQLLKRELSEEEWRTFKEVVKNHMKREKRKNKLLACFDEDETLKSKYGDIYALLQDVVSDEELERYEECLRDYKWRKRERERWLEYLRSFPKLKMKYAEEYERLQEDLSLEEFNLITWKIHFEDLILSRLCQQYDEYVRVVTEENYALGKVETLYTGYINSEELFRKYPEETDALIKYYAPEFIEYFYDKSGNLRYKNAHELYAESRKITFRNITKYKEFIERNNIFTNVVITDKEYNIINGKLTSYIPYGAIRGIAGTFTGYSITYEKFLEVKERYPKDVEYYASKEIEDEDIIYFINKMHPYLTRREIHYKV